MADLLCHLALVSRLLMEWMKHTGLCWSEEAGITGFIVFSGIPRLMGRSGSYMKVSSPVPIA